MSMSESFVKTMLENKLVKFKNAEYRLTIEKDESYHIHGTVYTVYLSDVHSPFTREAQFYTLDELKNGLTDWLRKAHGQNRDPETKLFDQLYKWNGVVVDL